VVLTGAREPPNVSSEAAARSLSRAPIAQHEGLVVRCGSRESRLKKRAPFGGSRTFALRESSSPENAFDVPHVPVPLIAALGRFARSVRRWFTLSAGIFPPSMPIANRCSLRKLRGGFVVGGLICPDTRKHMDPSRQMNLGDVGVAAWAFVVAATGPYVLPDGATVVTFIVIDGRWLAAWFSVALVGAVIVKSIRSNHGAIVFATAHRGAVGALRLNPKIVANLLETEEAKDNQRDRPE